MHYVVQFLAAKDDHTEEGVGEKTAEGEDGVELESVLLARKARKAEAPGSVLGLPINLCVI